MRVAVTGGTGLVGRFIVDALQRTGADVRLLSRPDFQLGDRPDLEGCAALVHCAFQHAPGRYRGGEGDDPDGFIRANLDGSVRLFEAAKADGVQRVIFLSSRAVYGDYPAGTLLTEALPPRPETLYGQVKWGAEQALQRLNGSGFSGASVRATGVYGPGDGHKWTDLFDAFTNGEPIQPRHGTEVHGDDLANAVMLLLRHCESGPFNVSDIVLDRRELLARWAALSGDERTLPEADGTPVSAMDFRKIQGLGWAPSGFAGLDAALARMWEEHPKNVDARTA